MLAAFRWLVVGLLFWILADVAPLYHAGAAMSHNFYTALGAVCFAYSIVMAIKGDQP